MEVKTDPKFEHMRLEEIKSLNQWAMVRMHWDMKKWAKNGNN